MNIQGQFPLGWTGLITLLPKGLSRVFSSTAVQKHQFFGTQPSLWPNSHTCSILIIKCLFLLLKDLSHLPAVSEVNAGAGPSSTLFPAQAYLKSSQGYCLGSGGQLIWWGAEIQLLF